MRPWHAAAAGRPCRARYGQSFFLDSPTWARRPPRSAPARRYVRRPTTSRACGRSWCRTREINMIIMNMLTIAASVFAASFILLATDVCRSGARVGPERLPVSSWRHRLRPPPRGRPARIRYCPAGEPRSVVGRRAWPRPVWKRRGAPPPPCAAAAPNQYA